jgi:environmental stress-induced protein Ves
LLIRAASLTSSAWRNGGGIRWGILEPEGWELAFARIAHDGPFSDYAGQERTILLLQGRGFRLEFGDGTSLLVDRAHVPQRFDGGTPTVCRLLDGPCEVLNLMAVRKHGQPVMRVEELSADLSADIAAATLLAPGAVLDGEPLQVRDTVLPPARITGRATAALVTAPR